MACLLDVCYQPLSKVVDIFQNAKPKDGNAGGLVLGLSRRRKAEAASPAEHEYHPEQHELRKCSETFVERE